MAIIYNQDFRNCKNGLDVLTKYPTMSGKNGYYFLFPNGPNSNGVLTYCDMTTDGGGWMLVARSHSSGGVSGWGWRGGPVGNVKTFTAPYQLGIWANDIHNSFTSYIFGHRANINNHDWGPFIYKLSGISNFNTFMTSEAVQYYTTSVVKSTTAIWNYNAFPGMQSVVGFPISATASNHYMMRDCCGIGYGAFGSGMSTVYIGHADLWAHAGPWGAGSTTDGSGNFTQTTADPKVSGTNQYMIMVK